MPLRYVKNVVDLVFIGIWRNGKAVWQSKNLTKAEMISEDST